MKHQQPNILFILTDDQGAWALGAAGNGEVLTPNLDRLAKDGVLFSNFFCASPVCSPARASILTGRIPSQHGIHDWIRDGNVKPDPITYLEGFTTYTSLLADHGYTCGLSGKWHLGNSSLPQQGFDHWYSHKEGGGPYYGAEMFRNGELIKEEGYLTDCITDDALKFIEAHGEQDAPFYLSVHYTAPHSPWDAHEHPEDLRELYADCPFNSCPNVPMHPWQMNSAPWGRTPDRRRELLTGYYSALTSVDKNVGRLLGALEEQGIRDNTLIIFTSDNGMNMGHHGIYGKGNGTFPQNMFDTSIKVPMIIHYPKAGVRGVTSQQMLSHYDIFPTLLELVGIANTDGDALPGQSFLPILEGEEMASPRPVVIYDEYGPVRMIRTDRWKYVHRYPYGPHELYDLQTDPDEETNIVDSPGSADVCVELKEQLEAWFAAYVNPAVDGTKEPVTGRGQRCLSGLGAKGKPAFWDDFEFLRIE